MLLYSLELKTARPRAFPYAEQETLQIMSKEKFKTGQHVIYSTNGLCLIKDIQYMSFIPGTEAKDYYILKPIRGNSSTIYVPTDNDTLMGKMRHVMTKEEIDKLLSSIKSQKITWEDNRKIRTENFHNTLINGVNADLLLMISCIYMKKKEMQTISKTLSASDSKFLENAEKLVEEEFAFTLDIPPSEVGKYIRSILDQ